MVVLELLVLGITVVDSWFQRLGIELQPIATKKKQTMPLVMNYTKKFGMIWKKFGMNLMRI
jgi:hypothetical protein